jgi:hypothetical protein
MRKSPLENVDSLDKESELSGVGLGAGAGLLGAELTGVVLVVEGAGLGGVGLGAGA